MHVNTHGGLDVIYSSSSREKFGTVGVVHPARKFRDGAY